jgi:hypothetical protein
MLTFVIPNIVSYLHFASFVNLIIFQFIVNLKNIYMLPHLSVFYPLFIGQIYLIPLGKKHFLTAHSCIKIMIVTRGLDPRSYGTENLFENVLFYCNNLLI